MPRVALIVPSFPALSETFIVSKFLGLLERGWDVHMITTTRTPGAWGAYPQLQSRGIRRRVHRAWPMRPRLLGASLWPAAMMRAGAVSPVAAGRLLQQWSRAGLGETLRRSYAEAPLLALKPDIVHFEFGALAVGRLGACVAMGSRIIVSFRGYDLNYAGLSNSRFYEEVWSRADAVHVLSRKLWETARERGCGDIPHVVIPPAVEVEDFAPVKDSRPGLTNRPLRLLSVGRLDWVKGYEYALEAVRRVVDAGVSCRYTIVGAGPHEEAVAFAIHQLGLCDTVDLVGSKSHEAVRRYMAEADVFVHSAVSEGFCNAVLEAQAMALPVVCSDAGGLPENVADGTTGFVVPRRNPDALAQKIIYLARDPARRSALGSCGRRRVMERFRVSDQITQFDRLYRSVLGRKLGRGVPERESELVQA